MISRVDFSDAVIANRCAGLRDMLENTRGRNEMSRPRAD
jgi:hypothetical protein